MGLTDPQELGRLRLRQLLGSNRVKPTHFTVLPWDRAEADSYCCLIAQSQPAREAM